MDRSGETYSYFSQTGMSFDEIVLEGASGGVDSLIRYLQSRRQMFLRDSSQISLRNEDPVHYVRAIEVKRQDDYARIVGEMTARNMLSGDKANSVPGYQENRASTTSAQWGQNHYDVHTHQSNSKCAPARSCDRTPIASLWNRGSCCKKGMDFETFKDRLLNLLLEALFGRSRGCDSPWGGERNFGIQRCCCGLQFV